MKRNIREKHEAGTHTKISKNILMTKNAQPFPSILLIWAAASLTISSILVPIVQAQCDSGWSYYAGTNKCFQVITTVGTFAVQQQQCQSNGGTLAVINSQTENDFVTQYAASQLGASTTVNKYAFIGLSRPANGVWKWTDGTAPSYTNWQPNVPDELAGTAAVGTIVPVVKTVSQTDWGWKVGGWDDHTSDTNQYAVCQKVPSACESGWSYYAGTSKCFHVITTVATFAAQQQQCQASGGTLAVINSQAENDFVTQYAANQLGASTTVNKYAFIGLSRPANGVWKWTDGTAPSYTNWQPNVPDELAGSAAVGTIVPVVKTISQTDWGWKVGGWDDHTSETNQYAVCQKASSGAGSCTNSYTLARTFAGSTFYDNFNFVTGTANGQDHDWNYGVFVSRTEAESAGLISMVNGQAKIWVDHTTVLSSTAGGRKSVNMQSVPDPNTGLYFNGGVVLFDFQHLPVAKGLWPAFWLSGTNCGAVWPNCGEMDILEYYGLRSYNQLSGHTGSNCAMTQSDSTEFTGSWLGLDCNQGGLGCSIKGTTDSTGAAVNAGGGGVYATEWIKDQHFKIWFFPRANIPADIASGNPQPCKWGKPMAMFRLGAACTPDHFTNMRIIIDTFFCGYDGLVEGFSGATIQDKYNSCVQYVQQNTTAFNEGYWLVNYVKVFT